MGYTHVNSTYIYCAQISNLQNLKHGQQYSFDILSFINFFCVYHKGFKLM